MLSRIGCETWKKKLDSQSGEIKKLRDLKVPLARYTVDSKVNSLLFMEYSLGAKKVHCKLWCTGQQRLLAQNLWVGLHMRFKFAPQKQ